MTDRKSDAFTSTGSHRAWVGEGVAPGAHASGSPRDGARNWLARPQQAPNSRHAAITKSLFNFPSYKSWTERMKSNWEKDQEK
jgi:hypothetical protein